MPGIMNMPISAPISVKLRCNWLDSGSAIEATVWNWTPSPTRVVNRSARIAQRLRSVVAVITRHYLRPQ